MNCVPLKLPSKIHRLVDQLQIELFPYSVHQSNVSAMQIIQSQEGSQNPV